MIRIILKDTSSGIIDQDNTLISAHVSQSECSSNVGSNGLDLVGLAPVDVGAARDAGGVEHVGWLGSREVGFE